MWSCCRKWRIRYKADPETVLGRFRPVWLLGPFCSDLFFGQGPFAQGPFSQGPFAQGPFGQGAFGQGPFSQGPFSQGPFAQGPFSQGPFSLGPFAQGPFAQGPFGQGPFGSFPTRLLTGMKQWPLEHEQIQVPRHKDEINHRTTSLIRATHAAMVPHAKIPHPLSPGHYRTVGNNLIAESHTLLGSRSRRICDEIISQGWPTFNLRFRWLPSCFQTLGNMLAMLLATAGWQRACSWQQLVGNVHVAGNSWLAMCM